MLLFRDRLMILSRCCSVHLDIEKECVIYVKIPHAFVDFMILMVILFFSTCYFSILFLCFCFITLRKYVSRRFTNIHLRNNRLISIHLVRLETHLRNMWALMYYYVIRWRSLRCIKKFPYNAF